MQLPAWEDQSAAICDRIQSTRGALKVVLKTKDDPFFLSDWVAHHRKIVGAANIVIFDNGSSDPQVLAAYAAMEPGVLVATFKGFHNNLHSPPKFPALYSSLAASSDFYCFLDTDEFLTFFDGERFVVDESILSRLQGERAGDFIPTTWLYNAPSYRDRMICGTNLETLRNGLTWGKPLIRSEPNVLPSEVNHNCQIAKGKKAPQALFGFFLLHMATLSPAQRIRANMNKLIARGFIQHGDSVSSVVNRDLSRASDNEKLYVNEIKRMLSLREDAGPPLAPLAAGVMQIEETGKVQFASALEEHVFSEFVERFESLCADVLPY